VTKNRPVNFKQFPSDFSAEDSLGAGFKGPKILYPPANTREFSGVQIGGACEEGIDVTISGSGTSGSFVTPCLGRNFDSYVNFMGLDGIKNIVATQIQPMGTTCSIFNLILITAAGVGPTGDIIN